MDILGWSGAIESQVLVKSQSEFDIGGCETCLSYVDTLGYTYLRVITLMTEQLTRPFEVLIRV